MAKDQTPIAAIKVLSALRVIRHSLMCNTGSLSWPELPLPGQIWLFESQIKFSIFQIIKKINFKVIESVGLE